MNKKIVLSALALGAFATLGLTGCGKTYTVTFDCDPTITTDNITVTYKKGAKKLSNIPTPIESAGFAGVWEEFSLNNQDITVNAVYGDGSEESPFLVATPNQFKNILINYTFESDPIYIYFKLINDIDLSQVDFATNLNLTDKIFSGQIDGNGHKLLNLDASKLTGSEGALFHNAIDAKFKNMKVYLSENGGSLVKYEGSNVVYDNVITYNANGQIV